MKQLVGEVWKAASADEARPVLTQVYFDAEKATLAATDSYILAVVPCEVEDGDESGLIPAAALKAQAKAKITSAGERASLSVSGGVARLDAGGTVQEWKLGDGTFPNVDVLIPSGDAPVRYGFSPDFLQAVADALGCGGKRGFSPMVMHPTSPLKACKVTGPHGGVGIIMPIRLEGDNGTPPPDLTNDAKVVEAVKAAYRLVEQRRSKKQVAAAFRAELDKPATVPPVRRVAA